MESEYQVVPLGELYEYKSGLSKPRSAFGSGFGFLSFKDVFYNFFVPENLTELVNSTPKEQESCSVQRGDVFLTRTSETMDELGMSCVALRDYDSATFNGFCKRLRPRPESGICPEFAAYYFRSPYFRRSVTAMSSMSTRASLNNSMLDRLTMLLPPVNTQISIAKTLKVLDDKIELNRKMNRTLEKMAQALFKSWFIDFDGHDDLVDSELGPIPKGWSVSSLGDEKYFSLIRDKASCFSGTKSYIATGDVRDLYVTGSVEVGFDTKPSRADRDPSSDTIWFAKMKDSRKLLFAMSEHSTYWRHRILSTGFCGIDCSSPELATYLFVHVATEAFDDLKNRLATGTTMQAVNDTTVRGMPVIVPPEDALTAFSESVRPLFLSWWRNFFQSQTLTQLRDTLLPKLISGEIRVPEAEKAVESAL